MTTTTSERTITVHWEDPRKLGEAARGLTGMEFLQKIVTGELPPPPVAALMNFELVELSEGYAIFAVEPKEYHYNVLPGHWRAQAIGVVLGCKATVKDIQTGKILEASGVLDFGPKAKLGEASIACAKFFGIPSSPKHGGTPEKRFIYTFFPGIPAVINGVTYQLQPM